MESEQEYSTEILLDVSDTLLTMNYEDELQAEEMEKEILDEEGYEFKPYPLPVDLENMLKNGIVTF